jgi:hypothetical protein
MSTLEIGSYDYSTFQKQKFQLEREIHHLTASLRLSPNELEHIKNSEKNKL